MENKKRKENLHIIDDIKSLIKQGEDKELHIMNIDVNIPNKNKYRIEYSYRDTFEELIEPFQEKLIEISEHLYKNLNKEVLKTMNLSNGIKYTLLNVSICSNSLGNYVKIDVPAISLTFKETKNSNILYLRYVSEQLEPMSIQLTDRLHSFIDKHMRDLLEKTEINHYELTMYYDGNNLLYSGFVQTTEYDYCIEKYNVFKLVKDEQLLQKLNDKLLNSGTYIPKNRFFKATFIYKDNKINSLNCLPLVMSS